MDITEFLLARVAEEEAVEPDDIDSGMCATYGGTHYPQARVLAECKAKRAIVTMLYETTDYAPYIEDQVLRNLAAVYADHPDYREEWAA